MPTPNPTPSLHCGRLHSALLKRCRGRFVFASATVCRDAAERMRRLRLWSSGSQRSCSTSKEWRPKWFQPHIYLWVAATQELCTAKDVISYIVSLHNELMNQKSKCKYLYMHNHIMKKSGRLQQKGSAPPSNNMEKSSTCFKGASAHKIIYRKIRPWTAGEMNRRGSGPRMVLIHYHTQIITSGFCAKSLVYKKRLL